MARSENAAATRTARRAFWILLLVAVLAAGSLTSALGSHPAPATGARVAASGLVLVASITLAGRVLLALDRARSRSRQHPGPHP